MRVKLPTTVMLLACAVLFLSRTAEGKPWKGIVPLSSNRADVEKLLGAPTGEDSEYQVDEARVLINYSGRGCQEGLPGGWKIPVDTVVSIVVSAPSDLMLDAVLASGKNYDQIYSVRQRPMVDYVDVQEGVRYSTNEGAVLTITYFGSEADDKKLRCGEYKYAAPVPAGAKFKFEQVPYDSYGKIPFADAEARLDSFIGQLQSMNEGKAHYRGYIIVYSGRSAIAGEAGTMAECSKNYLISVRKAAPETIITADGGYRDELTIELYLIPTDAYPPMLTPTVSPKQVEILPGHLSPCPIQE